MKYRLSTSKMVAVGISLDSSSFAVTYFAAPAKYIAAPIRTTTPITAIPITIGSHGTAGASGGATGGGGITSGGGGGITTGGGGVGGAGASVTSIGTAELLTRNISVIFSSATPRLLNHNSLLILYDPLDLLCYLCSNHILDSN